MTTIEQEIKDLKDKVKQLESRISQREQFQISIAFSPGEPVDQEQLQLWLAAEGLVARLPPAAQKQAKKWRKMPEAEKREHIRSMRDLKLDPPLSQIIAENRQ